MKGCVAVLLLLALAGIVSSWNWQVHVIIYLIARMTLAPFKELKKWEEVRKNAMKDSKVKKLSEEKKLTIAKEVGDKFIASCKSKEVQQRLRILTYFDDLASKGGFRDHIQELEAKGKNIKIKDILSHHIGMAGWPDQVSIQDNSGGKYCVRAHYYDQTYNKDGSPTIVTNPDCNVLKTLQDAYQTLMSYEKSGDKKPERKAHMLSYLIHMVGDMHQPLHMITRCEKQNTMCDGGGSIFFITGFSSKKKDANCLHKLWDYAMTKIDNINDVDTFVDGYTKTAEKIIKNFGNMYLGKGLRIDNIQSHAEEMFRIGKYAYDEIEKDDKVADFLKKYPAGTKSGDVKETPPKLPSEYVDNGYKDCEFLIMVAGYRLSDLLKRIYFANHPGEELIVPPK